MSIINLRVSNEVVTFFMLLFRLFRFVVVVLFLFFFSLFMSFFRSYAFIFRVLFASYFALSGSCAPCTLLDISKSLLPTNSLFEDDEEMAAVPGKAITASPLLKMMETLSFDILVINFSYCRSIEVGLLHFREGIKIRGRVELC